jgi:hypothetical protein
LLLLLLLLPAILISSNEYLSSPFESDILVRVPKPPIPNSIPNPDSNFNPNGPSRSDYAIINIEVDGIYHKLEKKKWFCMLRDKYLKSQGVIIIRIEASVLGRMKDEELKMLHPLLRKSKEKEEKEHREKKRSGS